MGIVGGAMTVRRMRVFGDLPEGWRELFRDRLNELAFRDPEEKQGKEEVEGWVLTQNLLDTDFTDFNRWLFNNQLVLALRVDKKTLPAKLLNATVQKRCEAWCQEKEVERCPASIKKEIKENLEDEWLDRTLPRVAVTEAIWNIDAGYLLIHSLSSSTHERFKKRFHRTFGLKLVDWSPLDWLADAHTAQALLATAPAELTSGELKGEDDDE
jgi:recombination associated protein RdgC